MILKCGQKNNQKYTFGIKKEEKEEEKKICCASCGSCFADITEDMEFCCACGEKL